MTGAARVGFIGLGQVGQPMAARLTAWPGGVIVHDVRAETTRPLAAAGAAVAGSLAEVWPGSCGSRLSMQVDKLAGEHARTSATD
jgi:phosphoglycerate dehydrogenase-like enzyme